MKKKKNNKKKNIPFIIFATIFAIGVVALCILLFKMKHDKEAFKAVAKIKNDPVITQTPEGEECLEYYLIDNTVVQAEFKDLYLKNNDTIGWLKIDGMPIDYPVMFTPTDEQFYLYKDFEKNYSASGSIFMGAEGSITRPSENMILYGHHMANNTMFKPLDKYMDEGYYKKHKYITFDTLRTTGTYEVIAAFQTKIVYYEQDGFMYYKYSNLENKETFNKFIEECNKIKLYDTDAKAEFGDQLITLSTCAYHTYNGRFVVVAKKIDGKEVDLNRKPIEVITSKEK